MRNDEMRPVLGTLGVGSWKGQSWDRKPLSDNILIILITLWLNPIWQTLVELHHTILFALAKLWPHSTYKVALTSYLYFWERIWQADLSTCSDQNCAPFSSPYFIFQMDTFPYLDLECLSVLSCVNSLPSVRLQLASQLSMTVSVVSYNWRRRYQRIIAPPCLAQMLESKYFLYLEEGNSKQTNEVKSDTVCVGRPRSVQWRDEDIRAELCLGLARGKCWGRVVSL